MSKYESNPLAVMSAGRANNLILNSELIDFYKNEGVFGGKRYQRVDTDEVYKVNAIADLEKIKADFWIGETGIIHKPLCIMSSVTGNKHIFVEMSGGSCTVYFQDLDAVTLQQTQLIEEPVELTGSLKDFNTLFTIAKPEPTIAPQATAVIPAIPAMESFGGNDNSYKNIATVFERLTKVQPSRDFLNRMVRIVNEYEMRSEEHTAFLGGNAIGTVRLRYFPSDQDQWADELLKVDDVRDLDRAYESTPEVVPGRIVTSSSINASFVYIAHRFMSSTLSLKEREVGAKTALKMMLYKFIASLLHRRFHYGANEGISNAVYENLTKKSALKRYHTWAGVVEARCSDIIDVKSIHYKTLMSFKDDKAILYMISDIQTRIRSQIQLLTDEYYAVRENDTLILSNSGFMTDEDGDQVMKDYVNKTDRVRREMQTALRDRRALILDELLTVTIKNVTTADQRYLEEALSYMVYAVIEGKKMQKVVEEFANDLISYIEYLIKTAKPGEDNIINIVIAMRNTMRSSQLTQADAVKIRDDAGTIVDKALPRRPKQVLVSTRIAIIIYLTIRILVFGRKHS